MILMGFFDHKRMKSPVRRRSYGRDDVLFFQDSFDKVKNMIRLKDVSGRVVAVDHSEEITSLCLP